MKSEKSYQIVRSPLFGWLIERIHQFHLGGYFFWRIILFIYKAIINSILVGASRCLACVVRSLFFECVVDHFT